MPAHRKPTFPWRTALAAGAFSCLICTSPTAAVVAPIRLPAMPNPLTPALLQPIWRAPLMRKK